MSELRLTRGEYWLLEAAVEFKLPLNGVASADVGAFLNKTEHGLSRDALLDTLERLVVQGFIRTHRQERGEFAPTRDEIAAALDEPRDMRWDQKTSYGLTPAGGAAWESFAAPDWNRFIECGVDDDDRYDATCADRRRLHAYLAALRREGTFQEASLVWDEVAPWQATYWKQLPLGHRARFVCTDGRLPDPPSWWYFDWYQWG